MERIQGGLRTELPDRAFRWARPDQFHLTLKFLGEVDPARLEELRMALTEAARGIPPLQMEAIGLGCFPNPKRPRVVWAGLSDGAGMLPRLQAAVGKACASFTAKEPEDRFSAHITLARVKDAGRAEAERLARAMARYDLHRIGAWTAREVELFRSELFPRGARHTRLFAVPLTGKCT